MRATRAVQNVEVKHELRDPALCRAVIVRLGARLGATLRQRDTYFRVTDGRLKRRETEGEETEWILYHRLNRPKATLSHFKIFSEAEAAARYGEKALPEWVVVEKVREVWLMGDVRLHLDEVARLGRFFEIEALVTPKQHVGLARRAVVRVQKELGPILGEAIAVSYSDMLAGETE